MPVPLPVPANLEGDDVVLVTSAWPNGPNECFSKGFLDLLEDGLTTEEKEEEEEEEEEEVIFIDTVSLLVYILGSECCELKEI